MTITRLLARPLLASMFVAGGVNALRNTEVHAAKAKKVADRVVPLAQQAAPGVSIPTDPVTLVRINAGAQILAAAALATGRVPRLSATVLAASLVPTTLAGHPFWEETDPQAKSAQRLQFVKNASVLGGLLLAGVDTEGKPGLAWRARRAASDVRREAKQVAKDARREAKLAKAQLT
ncbi:DoxX family membrane protein [Nocardioides sp. zg-1308]|uniref:DoxX family membrane protein n=1 Tax=Nocardioides renjunii TaxID=3095075 RepID=A0ABU5KCH3_9ACTN|nr:MULTISPECIES: DoxX family membrane protein [unclassified Nocardioides]MDZ5662576.1 DoxX family membrane protein [Nocardioides sp. S-58]NPD05752.1 DoxX family membrane protein [Nocardioides sp. zg-1308]WQQ23630.1 DoxX family membrane protein [Nocardioides sp. S-34]